MDLKKLATCDEILARIQNFIKRKNNDFKSVLRDIDQLLELSPGSSRLVIYKAEFLVRGKFIKEAEKFINQMLKLRYFEDSVAIPTQKSKILYSLNKLKLCLDQLETVLKQDPKCRVAVEFKNKIQRQVELRFNADSLFDAEEWVKSQKEYETCYKILKGDYPVQTAYCQLRQAQCFEKLGKDITAWELVNLSLKEDETSIEALIFRASIVQKDSIDFNEIALGDLQRVKAFDLNYERIEERIRLIQVKIASRRFRNFYEVIGLDRNCQLREIN